MKDFMSKLLNDLRVELSDEFDKNFERKAFFNKRWKPRKHGRKGTLMMVTGKLRRSLRSSVNGRSITWTSSEPYAAIHNEGGTITVTAKMKRFFWAKYYEAGGKIKYNKSGAMSKSSQRASDEAEYYKSLALMRVGSKITIPERRFIGEAEQVTACVEKAVKDGLNNVLKEFTKKN